MNLSDKIKISIRIIGSTLIVFHGLILGYLRNFSLESLLMGVGLISSIGLLYKKEWARKLFIVNCSMAMTYYAGSAVFVTKSLDQLSAMISAAWLMAIVFYSIPVVKETFQSGSRQNAKTILVIDDDKTFLRLLKGNFNRQGVSVLTAVAGEQGIEMAIRYKPDLIILDVIMPGIKGVEVCNRLKEEHQTKEIPVIFLTVKNALPDIAAELEAGGVVHIPKPVDFAELLSTVNNILGG